MSIKRLTQLAFQRFKVGKTNKNSPIVIHHGLFGSKQNWKSLAKSISLKCDCPVYAVDARNHGDSPHQDEHTYEIMAKDLSQFIKQQELEQPILLGHSMGGKTVMGLALTEPDLISRLIVVDIAPVIHPLSRDYYGHIDVMKEIQALKLTKQKDAYDMIAKVEPDLLVQQFLLTNLKKNKEDGVYQFRIGLDNLGQSLGSLGQFVPLKPNAVYTRPTLFITGGDSPFRKPFLEQPDAIKALFPNSSIKNVEGVGHWVQAENPDAFLKHVIDFVNKS